MKWQGLGSMAIGLCLFAQVAKADWTSAQRITWTSGTSLRPDIVVDPSGNLHVVWYDDMPGNYQIYYKKSADGGTTWTSAQRLILTSGQSYDPAIAVDSSGNLHVVWGEYHLENDEEHPPPAMYYKKSADGGTTWTSAQRLTWTVGGDISPAIVVDSFDNLHVVWCDYLQGNGPYGAPPYPDIYYMKSADGGSTWTSAQRITWIPYNSLRPDIAADSSGNLHVVWCDDIFGQYEIYYKKSADGGSTWTSAQRLILTSGQSVNPAIAIDSSGNLHVIWYDDTPGQYEIYYKKSADGGSTWTSAQRITWTPKNSNSPAISIDSFGNLHVVWYDYTPGNAEIYYKKSADGGTTWTSAQRLILTSGQSVDPAIAIDSSGNLHVVWCDDTPGNWEIYYKKGK